MCIAFIFRPNRAKARRNSLFVKFGSRSGLLKIRSINIASLETNKFSSSRSVLEFGGAATSCCMSDLEIIEVERQHSSARICCGVIDSPAANWIRYRSSSNPRVIRVKLIVPWKKLL